jgi:hypothetical protein
MIQFGLLVDFKKRSRWNILFATVLASDIYPESSFLCDLGTRLERRFACRDYRRLPNLSLCNLTGLNSPMKTLATVVSSGGM